MKVVTVAGARPQFIKAAAFSAALRAQRIEEALVHTGQHYDDELSAVFFQALELPEPRHRLGVGSGPHGEQTGRMLERLEPVLQEEAPDWVVVFGDTNSTLAGALAAAKLGLPLAHVEAGLRSFNRTMPEEINRIVTDHCSDLLFCPTQTAFDQLSREGLAERARLTGDIMYDALLQHLPLIEERTDVIERLKLHPKEYVLATVHRAANTDDPAALGRILEALALLDEPVVFPIHPRARAALVAANLEPAPNVRVIEPVGYLEMLALERSARVVLTDSGGVQKEAYLLGVPCVTLREETEWPETCGGGWNVLAGTEPARIVEAAQRPEPTGEPAALFGDGHAAQRMVELLRDDPSHGARRG
ncbi:MAG: UDP-N-acetylglucosamine 2-epimerase (non-hydrolyzing) [Chloroflexi bacterium]|nr:UDP-N-acetylglucosamine 2-epimerase (non-hydrolyzing) [Chloroflexota bacterium]